MAVNAKDEDGRTILHHTKGDLTELLDNGEDPNIQDEGGWSPLMGAASAGDYEKAKSLLQAAHINVNLQTEGGATALHYAAGRGRNDIVALLLQRDDIALDLQDHNSKQSALLRAVVGGHMLSTQQLVQRGCKRNLRDIEGNTALHHAVMADNIDLVLFLIENGARTDVENHEHKTPLDVASPFIKYRVQEET